MARFLLVNNTSTRAASRTDAKHYATPTFDQAFCDALALPGYAPSAQRGTVTGNLAIAGGFSAGAMAVLDTQGVGFQRAIRQNSLQYWPHVGADGTFSLATVRPGAYRLTVCQAGVFGEYDNDAVHVTETRIALTGAAMTLTKTSPPGYSTSSGRASRARTGIIRSEAHGPHSAKRRPTPPVAF